MRVKITHGNLLGRLLLDRRVQGFASPLFGINPDALTLYDILYGIREDGDTRIFAEHLVQPGDGLVVHAYTSVAGAAGH